MNIRIGFTLASALYALCMSSALFGLTSQQPASLPVFTAPPTIPPELIAAMNADRNAFYNDLNSVISADKSNLLMLVDKRNSLAKDYVPADLVALGESKSYTCGRAGMQLRASAEEALEKMAKAALREGITLVVSSAYRSFDYQKTVYERNVRELGQAAADRESARPGTSQHQLGTAADFGSITDAFAETRAGKWLAENAESYGWSLSFPQGYEAVTGYRWESWHYRYIGPEAAAFQKKWFGGVQQYMLEFIDAWLKRLDS